MALFSFVRNILAGQPIDVFNNGDNSRDFTYIDDVVESVLRVVDRIPAPNPNWSGDAPDPGTSSAPYRIYNIGNRNPIDVMDFITQIEKAVGREAEKNFLPAQPGDVQITCADMTDFQADFDFAPKTPIEHGIAEFVAWYRDYYNV
jgi:UDP-glucuronate 4-epimerase